MLIQVLLVATDARAGETSVSSTIDLATADPRWPTWLVDAVTFRAQEGARRLREHLVAEHAIAGPGFVPLAAVVPAVSIGQS